MGTAPKEIIRFPWPGNVEHELHIQEVAAEQEKNYKGRAAVDERKHEEICFRKIAKNVS